MIYRGAHLVVLVTGLSFVSFGQLGPQYPPGGGYPGGGNGTGYPGNGRTGGGNGLPRLPFPGKKKKDKDKATKEQMRNLTDLRGILRRMDAKTLVLEADDKRFLQVVRNDESKLLKNGEEAKSTDFAPGDHVIVEAAVDDDNRFIAVRINWEKEGTEKERVSARGPLPETVQFEDDRKGPPEEVKRAGSTGGASSSRDRDDDGPPKMTRKGEPAPASKKPEEIASNVPPPSPSKGKASSTPAPAPEPEEVREKGTLVVDKVDLEPVPKVKRGRPAPRPRSADELDDVAPVTAAPGITAGGAREIASATSVSASAPTAMPSASGRPVIADGGSADPLLERAKESAMNFTEVLPNYTAKQMTTRFNGNGKADRWDPQDNFTADIVYQDGKENYTNVLLNGKPAKGKVEQTGAWSRGEFGTTLRDVFSPATNAAFKPRGSATISNRKAKYYDFTVEQENSHWQIGVPGQTYFPSYRGSVWIDIETARVLRIEMQGRRIPEAFPIDTVESAIDFDFVKIGGGSYLVPVHSESLSCFRSANMCNKNVIDFRNYRKFGAQSELILSQ